MTMKKLPVVLAALMMLACLSVPALAGARVGQSRRAIERAEKHHRRTASPGGCKLAMNAEPRTITSGETPELFGRLHCSEAARPPPRR